MTGIRTKLFYPEEVMIRENDMEGWMNTLNNDEYARKYVDIVAVHGYESTRVSAGQIGGDLWEKYYDEYVNYPGYPVNRYDLMLNGVKLRKYYASKNYCRYVLMQQPSMAIRHRIKDKKPLRVLKQGKPGFWLQRILRHVVST